MIPRAARAVPSAVAIAAALAVCLNAGAAGPPKPTAALASLNAMRAELRLTPLRWDPAAAAVAQRVARAAGGLRAPEVLEEQYGCPVCESFIEKGVYRDPRVLYRRAGGTGRVVLGLWGDGWGARDNVSVFFETAALVLDPRARTFAAARTAQGLLVVAVSIDPRAPFTNPVRWPRGAVDPRAQLWVQVLFPPGYGFPNLYDLRGEQRINVAYPLASVHGVGRARLVAFGLNTRIAYGRAYTIGDGSGAVGVRTRSAPSAFVRRTWRFSSMSDEERAVFLGIVARAPASLRRVLDELDGAVDVVGGGLGCSAADACESVEGDRATIGFSHVRDPFVVLHEIGHVVFDLALDERGRRMFLTAFRQAGWENACCINLSEVFADQLAFWALGPSVSPDVDSYIDEPLMPAAEYAALFHAHVAYRPLPTVGRLRR